jgi:hypothetical protein
MLARVVTVTDPMIIIIIVRAQMVEDFCQTP